LDVFFFDAFLGVGYQAEETFWVVRMAHCFTSWFAVISTSKHNTEDTEQTEGTERV
jgi:hypothetical protein